MDTSGQDSDLKHMKKADLVGEIKRLRNGIRQHRDAKGHDRCWMDDDRLYRLLPENRLSQPMLPPCNEFLNNCARFWRTRQPRGPEVSKSVQSFHPVKLSVSGWCDSNGQNIYNTKIGTDLSMRVFHSGTTFDALVLLHDCELKELEQSEREGYYAIFTLWASKTEDETTPEKT